MEGHYLGHPLFPGTRGVRVDVHPFGHLWVCLSRNHPSGVVELVATVVNGNDIHQQDVLGPFVQPTHLHLISGEDTSERKI